MVRANTRNGTYHTLVDHNQHNAAVCCNNCTAAATGFIVSNAGTRVTPGLDCGCTSRAEVEGNHMNFSPAAHTKSSMWSWFGASAVHAAMWDIKHGTSSQGKITQLGGMMGASVRCDFRVRASCRSTMQLTSSISLWHAEEKGTTCFSHMGKGHGHPPAYTEPVSSGQQTECCRCHTPRALE